MKKLLWCAGILGIILLIFTVVMGLNPDNQVLGIMDSNGADYREITIIKRDHTYEQFILNKNTGLILSNKDIWKPSSDDMASRSLMNHTGGSLDENITFLNAIDVHGKTPPKQVGFSIMPTMMIRKPDDNTLALWKEWKTKAQPFPSSGNKYKG